MPSVLVVDDSAVARCHLGELLANHAELYVRYAAHGGEALARMEEALPDLVVTDLIMPEVNGLELVRAVGRRYPLVPVILMTSKGCEELAVQALKQGAASYVPKQMLSQQLPDVIHRVLAISQRQRSRTRLMGCMSGSHCAFVLENDCELVPPLVAYLQEIASYLGLCEDADCTRMGIALAEALLNAICHGNLEIGSELRASDDPVYSALLQKRRREPPYCDRRTHVEAALSAKTATFDIRDEGPGFDPTVLPDPTDPANLEKASGRGILLMRTFMDEVRFNRKGNAVTLVKNCRRKLPGG